MPSPSPETPEPSAALRRGIRAALRRPVLLDPSAVEAVRSAAAFQRAHAAADDGAGFKAPPTVRDGDVAIVGIEGPLAQRAWSCMGMFGGDGYDEVLARARAALADADVRAIVLRIDSPGGEVAGNAETVKAIRAAARAAGKPVVAYADEFCASAAYALACAAAEIIAPPTGFAGSVGCIVVLADRTKANEAEGLNVRVVRSGALKATPHPDEPLTDAGVAKVQGTIDALARMFAADVAAARGLTPDAVLALEGACLLAADAQRAGLVDRLGNLSDAVARARALAADPRHATRKPMRMPMGAATAGVLASDGPAHPVGTRVRVRGEPHVAGQSTGEVREAVLSYAYGIVFDGMESMGVHHWYVESELEPAKADRMDMRAAQTTKRKRMETAAKALGLAADASEGDITTAIEDLKSGRATAEERVAALEAELTKAREADEKREHTAALAELDALGVAPALRAKHAKKSAAEIREVAADIRLDRAARDAGVKGARPRASAGDPPVPPPPASDWQGKRFEQLAPIERHRLHEENPELYAALRADAEKRGAL